MLNKTISNMVGSSKNIKKYQKAPTRTLEKSKLFLRKFLDEQTYVSTPSPPRLLKQEMNFKKMARASKFLKSLWEPKQEGEKIYKSHKVQDFFIFIFLLELIMVTETTFGKSSSGNIFLRTVVADNITQSCQFSFLNLDIGH